MVKRILVIAGGNYISGTEKVTLDAVEGLQKTGHQIHCVISGWTDGRFENSLSNIGVLFTKLKLGWYYIDKLQWSFDSLIHLPQAFFRFYQHIRVNKYDVIYTVSFRYIVLLYPLLRKNIVYHVHEFNSHSKQQKFFLRMIDRKVRRYIAVSKYIKNDLEACGIAQGKIEVVYNGTEIIRNVELCSTKTSPLNLGIVGQIIKRKGHENLLKAIQALRSNGYDVALTIVGSGDDAFINQLKQTINTMSLTPFVEWRPFTVNIAEIYKNIQLLVTPTLDCEPFGLVAIEANMLGIPVVVSNKGGLAEIVVNGENGFLIEAADYRDIEEKVMQFVNEPTLLKHMGENGNKRVQKLFSKEIFIKKVQQVIQQL